MCRTPCWPISVGQNVGTACPIIDEDAFVFQFLVKNHIGMTHYFSTWHTLIHTYSCVYFVVLGIDPRILPRPGYYKYLLMTVWETWRGRLLCAFILWMSMFVSAVCWEKNQTTLSFGPSSFDLLLLLFLFLLPQIFMNIFSLLGAENTEVNETVPLSRIIFTPDCWLLGSCDTNGILLIALRQKQCV